ncbi:MAG TPA: hypothetical protein VHN37_10890 [Actinomycetota bacterium]|nr:hypothetical protein [Actinomycetota bacterium]
MHQFKDQWQLLIVRMEASGVPDVIALQDVDICDKPGSQGNLIDFMDLMRLTFPAVNWDFRHTRGGNCGSGSAVVWNSTRFALVGSNMGVSHSCSFGAPALVALSEVVTGNRLAVASVHTRRNSDCAISGDLANINSALESLSPTRHMSLISGDFNTRPDQDGETLQHGLESNPDCWYTGFSALHTSGCTVATDRYYDSVWLEPAGGAGINPAVTSICHQYTKAFSFDTTIEPEEAGNSCTDLDGRGALDRNRIDYIWPSWELDNGSVCRPPLAEAQALVDFASADMTVSGTGVNRYSDHRAVEAIVNWLPPTPPVNVDGACTI